MQSARVIGALLAVVVSVSASSCPPSPPPISSDPTAGFCDPVLGYKGVREDVLKNVVVITSGVNTGLGFVVGESADEKFIVTAEHTLGGNGGGQRAVRVEFCQMRGHRFEGEIIRRNDRDDIAAVQVFNVPPRVNVQKEVVDYRDPAHNVHAWYLGREAECSYIPPTPGTVNTNERTPEGRLYFDSMTIPPGTSGAPVISSRGIIGMALTEHTALSLKKIRDVWEGWYLTWNLEDRVGIEGEIYAIWDAFNKGSYNVAISLAEELIGDNVQEAERDQQELISRNEPMPPIGRVADKREREKIFAQGKINDVGTAWWIKGRSLARQNKREEAKVALEGASRLPYARAYDTMRCLFWSPARSAGGFLASQQSGD